MHYPIFKKGTFLGVNTKSLLMASVIYLRLCSLWLLIKLNVAFEKEFA